MSRLLFAAARGAKIEVNSCLLHYRPTYQNWWRVTQKWSAMHESVIRIHPADEHLQYGPISTALREMAKQPKVRVHKVVLPHFGFTIFAESENEAREVLQCDTLTHSLFYLILAEALADEGL